MSPFLKLFIFACFGFVPLGLQAQELDSLKRIEVNMADDSLKCATLLNIAYLLYAGEESVHYSRRALKLAQKLENHQLIARAYRRLAWCLSNAQMEQKKQYLDSAELVFLQLNDLNGLGSTYDTRGTFLANYGSLADAQASYKQAFLYYQDANNPERQAGIYNNWAITDNMLRKPEKAIEKYNKALDFRLSESPIDHIAIARLYVGMAESSRQLENYSLATDYFFKSYHHRSSVNDIGVTEVLINLSALILEMSEKELDTSPILKKIKIFGAISGQDLLDLAEQVPGVSERPGFLYSIMDVRRKWHLLLGEYFKAYDLLEQQKKYDEQEKLSEQNLSAFADLKIRYQRDQLRVKLLQKQVEHKIKKEQLNLLIFISILLCAALLIGVLFYQNKMKSNQLVLARRKQETKIVAMQSLLEGQEKERSRIARDLHDGLGNLLSTLKANISNLEISFSGTGSDAVYKTASNMIDEACTEVRKIAHNMMPQTLKKLGLKRALEDLVRKLDFSHNYNVDFQSYGLETSLSDKTNVMIFRIVQEAVNNIIKYADATTITLHLIYSEDWLSVNIEDDGKGFKIDETNKERGLGLKSISFRAEYLKGTLDIDSRPGNGTLISLSIPLNDFNKA